MLEGAADVVLKDKKTGEVIPIIFQTSTKYLPSDVELVRIEIIQGKGEK